MKTHKVILSNGAAFLCNSDEAKYYKKQGYAVVKLLRPVAV
jgi:hypothetical protein